MSRFPDDSRVRSRIDQYHATHPMGQIPDPWAEFRSIEVIGLEWVHRYRHSLGKSSRFFLELEKGRLMATMCGECGEVSLPPRPVCPRDLTPTEWTELPGTGTLAGFSVLHRPPKAVPGLTPPYVLALAHLDGADSLFLHVLDVKDDTTEVEHGMRLKVVFGTEAVEHPIWLMHFEPLTDEPALGSDDDLSTKPIHNERGRR